MFKSDVGEPSGFKRKAMCREKLTLLLKRPAGDAKRGRCKK